MKALSGLNQSVTGLDGQPLTELNGSKVTLSSIIANSLARGQSQSPAQAMDLAMKLYKNTKDVFELEEAEFVTVKDAMVNDQLMNNLAKAAVLEVLNGAKDK